MTSPRSQSAFSLVEVSIALGIVSFCLVALIGLLPAGINNNRSSNEETAAVNLLTAVVSDLRSTAKTAAASPRFGISTTSSTTLFFAEDGTPGSADQSRFRVQTTLTAPSANQDQTATVGHILVSWPAAQSDPDKAAGFVEAFIGINRSLP